MGILLAIVAAASWGASNVFARLGSRSVRTTTGTFVSMLSSLAFIVLITLLFQRQALASVSARTILWFALIGLISYPFARYSQYKGVELIGASRSSALSAASPLFAMLVAVIFLREEITPLILSGVFLIIGGLYSLASHGDGASNRGAAGSKVALKRDNILGYMFSLFSALGWGGTAALTRWGVSHLAPPIIGVFIATTTGTLASSMLWARNLQLRPMSGRSGLGFFLLAGLVSAIGVTASYGALSLLPVVVVNPLSNTSPLFTLLFVFAFMRGGERITWRTGLGVALVIAGSTSITLGRAK